jgi:hypothetical protein
MAELAEMSIQEMAEQLQVKVELQQVEINQLHQDTAATAATAA